MDDGNLIGLLAGLAGGIGGLTALAGVFVGYGRLQGRIAGMTREIAEI